MGRGQAHLWQVAVEEKLPFFFVFVWPRSVLSPLQAVFIADILERKIKTLAITAFAHKMYGSWRDPQKILICTSSIISHLACSIRSFLVFKQYPKTNLLTYFLIFPLRIFSVLPYY